MRYSDGSVMARPHAMARRKTSRRGKLDLIFADAVFILILSSLCNLRNRIEQRPHQPVQFRIHDEMRGLLPAKRSAEHARKTQHRATAACQTPRRIVFAKQFTLHAKYCRLQGNEIHVGGRQQTLHVLVNDSLRTAWGRMRVNTCAHSSK